MRFLFLFLATSLIISCVKDPSEHYADLAGDWQIVSVEYVSSDGIETSTPDGVLSFENCFASGDRQSIPWCGGSQRLDASQPLAFEYRASGSRSNETTINVRVDPDIFDAGEVPSHLFGSAHVYAVTKEGDAMILTTDGNIYGDERVDNLIYTLSRL